MKEPRLRLHKINRIIKPADTGNPTRITNITIIKSKSIPRPKPPNITRLRIITLGHTIRRQRWFRQIPNLFLIIYILQPYRQRQPIKQIPRRGVIPQVGM